MIPVLAASLLTGVSLADTPNVNAWIFLHQRPDIRAAPAFVDGQDDTIIVFNQNARVGAGINQGPVSAVVELQDTRAWGTRANSVSTEAAAFAHQAYAELGSKTAWFRAGRQEVHLLNGYYISKAPWNIANRSFDAVRGHWENDRLSLDAFGLLLTPPVPKGDVQPEATLGDGLMGVLATMNLSEDFVPSLFVLGYGGGPTVDHPTRKKRWAGPGMRIDATPGLTQIDLNAASMFGDDTGIPIRAWSVIARVSQGLDVAWTPRFGLIFDQSSGHACAPDSPAEVCATTEIQDFDLHFGRNHHHRGIADQFMGANIRDLGAQLGAAPTEWLTWRVDGHLLQLSNPEGAWRRVGGSLQGAGWLVGNTDPNLAYEIDAVMAFTKVDAWALDGGYAFVQAIGAGAEMTGDAPQHYAYLRSRVKLGTKKR